MTNQTNITNADEFYAAVNKLCGIPYRKYKNFDFSDFIQEIDRENESKTSGYYSAFDFMSGDPQPVQTTFRGVPIEYIESEGGGEGGKEECYTVFKVFDQYFKVEYHYYSHEGYDFSWCTFKKVTPIVRPVTFYE